MQYNIRVRIKTQIRVRVRVRVRVTVRFRVRVRWRRHDFPEMTKYCESAYQCLSFVEGHELTIHADF